MRYKKHLKIKKKTSKSKQNSYKIDQTDPSLIREEERCRIREQELREKDTLIQDNLIRFSTFLQQ
jgi:hypothetical protein